MPDKTRKDRLTSLDETRFRLAAIAESSDDAIVGKDLDGVVTSWNKGAEAMFGYAADEIVGKSITSIIPADRTAEEADILRRIRGGDKIAHFETERRTKDGRIIPVSLTISPIRNDRGEIIGVAKMARDLTEAQRANRELQRREFLLGAILATVPDAMIVIDGEGIIQSFSATAARLFEYAPEEVVGRNVHVLMPAPYREEHDSYMTRYLRTGERHIIGIGRIVSGRRKSGSTFPMELKVGEVNIPGTRLFAGFVQDLTDRQDREHRLNELQAELVHVSRVAEMGQMVAALAHEVNQPLAAMTNYLSGIRRLLAAGKLQGVPEAIERVTEQADRARKIIQRLRDHVRKRDAVRQVEGIAQTIEEASALALVGVGQELKLEIRVDRDAGEAFIDKVEIQQVLFNLMRNAAEAMSSSPERNLSIVASSRGAMVEISVADTGPGLPAVVRDRLFQPFVTTKSAGMGIGLSVCRGIVEAHGGQLSVEERTGGGTIFRFTLSRDRTSSAPRVLP